MIARKFYSLFLWLVLATFALVNTLRIAVLLCGVSHLGRLPREPSDLKVKHSCIFTPQNLDEDILLFGFLANIPLLVIALFTIAFKLKWKGRTLLLTAGALAYEIAIRFTFWFTFVQFE